MAPYESLYGRACRAPLSWNEVGERQLTGPKIVDLTIEKVKILERIGKVSYRLALPPELSHIHNVFHVSILRKYIPDPSHVLSYQPVELNEDLTYEEEPVEILDRKEQVLRTKRIPLLKVLWRSHTREEATWEPEDSMRVKYPYLFSISSK
ncbi:hypothetical protein CRG98_026031 [Punica granatum]|uniref:Tf2-1-like SH3-like domain-containing protein n=1 Tax=Punica granatum TaxID=22663 RepID=A0A2I0JBF5_PUNGR|nr:hypothetical protein CRG98_026031 [Punica granatum]